MSLNTAAACCYSEAPWSGPLTTCPLFSCDATVPQAAIYHYMDDILIAAETQEIMEKALALTKDSVSQVGLQIAPEKVQISSPWLYLGWRICEQTIVLQQVKLKTDVKTLNDLQKLLGAINWIRPLLGLTNDDVHSLFYILRGDPSLTSLRVLTESQIHLGWKGP